MLDLVVCCVPLLLFPSLFETPCTFAFEVVDELCGLVVCCWWTDDDEPFTELGDTNDGVVVELVPSLSSVS